MATADDDQPTNEVELPGKPVASAAGAEATMMDMPMGTPPGDDSATAPFGHRPQPDVLFSPAPAAYQAPSPYQAPASPYQAPPPHPGQAQQPAFGPDDVTGPQAPQAAAQGYGAYPLAAAPVAARRGRRPALLITLVSALGIVVLAAAAFFLWSGGDHRTVAQDASASPSATVTAPPS